jgi:fructose-bisphosphate aldolase class I
MGGGCARIQMPLFQLCKATGELQLDAMSALYASELKIASASALGQLEPTPGQGDHVPPQCAHTLI